MPLILDNALFSSADGFVQSGKRVWFHFQKYPWNLCKARFSTGQNPGPGEHRRQIETRLAQGLPEAANARVLPGNYHLGISPHIYSYYHLLADLLPHLILTPKYPVLLPEFMPTAFIDFLEKSGFPLQILAPGIFQVERLWIPEISTPDWNLEKVRRIQDFFEKQIPHKKTPDSSISKPSLRLYISRKLAVKRHLSNEDEFLPLLQEYGFREVFLEKMSIPEQVLLFRNASQIVAAHGAGLTNTLFAPSEARILEIRPRHSSGQFCFDHLFAQGWPRHEVLVPPQKGNFVLPPELLRTVLEHWKSGISAFSEDKTENTLSILQK